MKSTTNPTTTTTATATTTATTNNVAIPKGKTIPGFSNYLVSRKGDIWNKKTGKKLKPYVDKSRGGYLKIKLSPTSTSTFKIHRLVALAFLPNPLDLPIVDHVNRNRIDNSSKNLRWVSSSTNSQNLSKTRKKLTSSKFLGVHQDMNSKKWVSMISSQGKSFYLGRFITELLAAQAYNKKAGVLGYLTRNKFTKIELIKLNKLCAS